MNKHDEELNLLKERLSSFSAIDFYNIALSFNRKILDLNDGHVQTAEFAFWFCHLIENTLDKALKESFSKMEATQGRIPEEQIDFVRNQYNIKLEYIISNHTKHNPRNIEFNDRINIVERINGKSSLTVLLRKIKGIRNDVSHGRIKNLTYDGLDLSLNSTKAKLLADYIELSISFPELESEGGIMNS